MTAALVSLLLFGAAGSERGAPGGLPEEAQALRGAPRLRAGAALGGLFGVANYDPTIAAVFTADVGVVLSDRVSLYARLEGGSLVFSLVGGFSLAADVHLGDFFSVGLGVKLQGWVPLTYSFTRSPFVGVMFPVRVSFAPFSGRPPGQVQRSGFVVGFEAAPGLGVLPTYVGPFGRPVDPEAGLTLSLTVGYAAW